MNTCIMFHDVRRRKGGREEEREGGRGKGGRGEGREEEREGGREGGGKGGSQGERRREG